MASPFVGAPGRMGPPGPGMGPGMGMGGGSGMGPGMGMGGGGPGMGGGGPGMMAPGMGGGMGGGMSGAAAAPAPLAEVNEALQARPAYLSYTMGAVPATMALAKRSALPFGLCVHPLAEGEGSLGPGRLPLVNFGAAGVVRCKKCRAYINPFSKFVDGGRRWRCNLCAFVNDVPPAYFVPTDADGNRPDVAERPELCCGSVEFVAPTEYMVRTPQPPVYLFVLDVSFAAVSTGVLATATNAILNCLDRLPGEDRAQVAFVTYDSGVHFYNLKKELRAPQMLVVPDVSDLFLPVPEELLVNLAESRRQVEMLLSALPGMFAHTRQTEAALGPALDAAFQVMQHIGGKMVVLSASLPSVGGGRLKVREAAKMLGSDAEYTLLAPDAGDAGNFYKAKAVDFSRQQISVDTFLFAHSYVDVATVGALSRYTAGQVYYYPGFTAAADGERLAADLARDLTRTTGFEAVMRIRCTKGVGITNFYGNFFIRGTDLLALPNVTCDTAFNVELALDEPLTQGSVIAMQTALLYTTANSERRINVHTMCKPVTTVLADLFRAVDVDAVCNMVAKVALDHTLRTGLSPARAYIQRAVVDIIRGYRTATSPYGGPGGVSAGILARAPPGAAPGGGPGGPGAGGDPATMLPPCLQLLPLYALSMQKCSLYRGGDNVRADERASLVYRMLSMPFVGTRAYMYPRMYSLHDMEDAAGRPEGGAAGGDDAPIVLPAVVNLSAARLVPEGVFLVDNGVDMYMWFGRAAPPALLHALFGVHSFDGVDMGALRLVQMGNDYSRRVNAVVDALRGAQAQAQKLRFVREGAADATEARFSWVLVEDRQNFRGGAIAYEEYPALLLRESQQAVLGGTDPAAS